MPEARPPQRWLLVYGWLRPGGIETLIVRTANHLVASGKEVAIACLEGPLASLLSPDVTLIDMSNLATMRDGARAWLAKSRDPVAMLSFDPISAAAGLAIESLSLSLIHI